MLLCIYMIPVVLTVILIIDINLECGLPKLRQPWVVKRRERETQMYFAKQGIITEEMEYVAIRENMNCEELGINTHITPAFVCKENCRREGCNTS